MRLTNRGAAVALLFALAGFELALALVATATQPDIQPASLPACSAYEPGAMGEAAVASGHGMTCAALVDILDYASGPRWISTLATDGIDWPKVARLRHGAMTIELWSLDSSNAAGMVAGRLMSYGWRAG